MKQIRQLRIQTNRISKHVLNSRVFLDYRKLIFVCALLLVMVIFAYYSFLGSPRKQLSVSFLDVGQGDAIFIETPSKKQILIDGGASAVVVSRLAEKMSFFDRQIDMIVATHPDADHVTGLIPVMQRYNVSTIVESGQVGETGIFAAFNDAAANEGAVRRIAQAGDVIDCGDGVTVRVLYPHRTQATPSGDTNSASVSVLLTYKEISFLLTGDLPSVHEGQLIGSWLPKNVTVYKAGHHGSDTSSGVQLLSYIRPEYAVISAGKDNKYGHPNPEAVKRLEMYSKEVLSTVDSGTITFVSDGRLLEVETDR